ncbi:MAG: acyl-ACP--UDP-N-acetylglucosamine O-acyltransferase [Planctomycetes bacterium]|nr:acyl-ACP--UDP-N-acetylglucosamine O-acyltransferase [Planctomycetota bacterium]
MIHPTALVDAGASIGADVSIGPYALVAGDVVVGDGCRIGAHAIVRERSQLGRAVVVDSFAVIGGAPQSRGTCHGTGWVRIGDGTVLREGVTVNQPTLADGATVIGRDCMLMANSHVGHDSVVGDTVTLANCVLLAGHVQIGDRVFLGGGAGVHQFVRIGQGAMIGGNASISYDVPPYAIAAERNSIHGLNLVGIRRQGLPKAAVADLKRCYHAVFCDTGNLRARAAAALASSELGTEPPGRAFLEFFASGKRGFAQVRTRRGTAEPIDDAAC